MSAPNIALTPAELELIELATTLWNKYLDLPDRHPCEPAEMQRDIHAIQQRVMARLAARLHPEHFAASSRS